LAIIGIDDDCTEGEEMKTLLMLLIFTFGLCAGQYERVKITPHKSYIYVYHKGKAVKVHRIQDTKHKITGEYAKIYRPGKFIQPIKIHKDIQTIGEVELLAFMQEKINKKQGLLVDLRPKKVYKKGSIPSAVNIPARVKDDKVKIKKILKIFGMKKKKNGKFNTKNVLDIVFYCNGLWCDKSSEFIHALLELGYPAKNIFYYRGGFQMWKILGFTTVTNQ
jgi:rhodanese-related sulfurtransferase